MNRDLEFYLSQHYDFRLSRLPREEGGGWLAEVPDLHGCVSDGGTPNEACQNLEEAKEAWLTTALRRGIEVPLPSKKEADFSGRITLRMPRSLHKKLAHMAETEDVSLNQLILSLVALRAGSLHYDGKTMPQGKRGLCPSGADFGTQKVMDGPPASTMITREPLKDSTDSTKKAR